MDEALSEYSGLLEEKHKASGSMGDKQPERQAVQHIEAALEQIRRTSNGEAALVHDAALNELERQVIGLQA